MANTSLQAVMAACLDGYAADHPLSPHQWQVCHHILDCRTAALGGFALECDQCGDCPFLYHACRDRHCPRCQRRASEDWVERQRAVVLPVTYHHLVFTPARHPQRLGRGPPGGDLWPAVRDGVGDPVRLR